MKFIFFFITFLLSQITFASGHKLTPPTVAPHPDKTLIFCDYTESKQYQIFIDIYALPSVIEKNHFGAPVQTYSDLEFGVFQNTEKGTYPTYLWNGVLSAVFLSEDIHFYTLSKDPVGLLQFSLNGTKSGIFFQKDAQNKILDFNLRVTGTMFYPNITKEINANFYCYDPSTKPKPRSQF